MLGLVPVIAALLFGYFLVAHLVPLPNTVFSHLFRTVLGLSVALGISSAAFFLLRLLGLDAHVAAWTSAVLLSLGAAALSRLRAPVLEGDAAWRTPPEDPFLGRLVGVCVLLAFIIASVVFAQAVWFRPYGDFDALAVWNLKAKFMALTDAAHFSETFSKRLEWAHQDYPLLVPGTVAQLWSTSGDTGCFAPIVVATIFFIGVPLLMLSLFSCIRRYFQGCIATLAILGSWTYVSLSATQYADVPLSMYALATMGCAYLGFTTKSARPFLLAGLCAALAAWTKNEGTAWCLVMLATISAGIFFIRGEFATRRFGLLLLGAASIFSVVALFKLTMAGSGDLFTGKAPSLQERLADRERMQYLCSSFARMLPTFLASTINPAIPLIAALPFVGVNLRAGAGIMSLVCVSTAVLMLGVFFAVYLMSPYNLHWLIDFTIDRLFIQIWPVAVLGFVLPLKPPERGLPR